MRSATALVLLLAAAPATTAFEHSRYERPLAGVPLTAAQTCVTLDAQVFAHATPRLTDLRLFQGKQEIPHVIRTDTPVGSADIPVTPLNLGMRNRQTTFDAVMPAESYSDLELHIKAENFIAAVTVLGSQTQDAVTPTQLGTFTVFDFTTQKLGRSTVLHLPEADFHYLHLRITGPLMPEQVTGLSVVREPIAVRSYVPVATTSQKTQQQHASVFEFNIPAHVPVDRLAFDPLPGPDAFSRDLVVRVRSTDPPRTTTDTELPEPATFSGNLLRLHREQDGQQIDEERLTLDTRGYVADQPTRWTIAVENGDDPPLSFGAVRLEMLEHDLCFEAAGGGAYSLFYGDPGLRSPRYEYAALFARQPHPARATAGPERPNPQYQPRPDARPFSERHPALLWIALILVICLLGTVALRSAGRPQTGTGA